MRLLQTFDFPHLTHGISFASRPDMPAKNPAKTIYWHRELPPLAAELVGEHTIDAASARVPGTIAHRDELWDRCYRDLMDRTLVRLDGEITRLGGHYAHVLEEVIDSRRDEANGEAWLTGRFSYTLYRRPSSQTL